MTVQIRASHGMATIVAVLALAFAACWPSASHATTKIQHLVTPGGISAWFVENPPGDAVR